MSVRSLTVLEHQALFQLFYGLRKFQILKADLSSEDMNELEQFNIDVRSF